MAGPVDPFTPGPTTDPTAGIPNQDTFESIRNQWTTFLDQPGARTFLLQAGAALLQPPSFGDTPASQIGRAVAAGGQAVTKGEALASRQELEESRAEAARARAGAEQERLGLGYFRQQAMTERAEQGRLIQAQKIYQQDLNNVHRVYQQQLTAWKAAEQKAQQQGKPNPLQMPEAPAHMDFQTWLRVRGASMLGLPQGGQTRPQAPAKEEEGE